ncbi:MAG: hypothetical protein ACRYG4_06530 [Janthinobacterium lividum]
MVAGGVAASDGAIEPLPDEPVDAPPDEPIDPDEPVEPPAGAIEPEEPESDIAPPLRGVIAEPVEPAEACSRDFWLRALVASDPLLDAFDFAW